MKNNYKMFYGNNHKKYLGVIPLGVGGSHLINLLGHDSYFKKVLLVVDGDTNVPKKLKNAIKLPCEKSAENKGFNPEKTLYSYIQELSKGDKSIFQETFNQLIRKGITTDRLKEDFLKTNVNIGKRESSKNWFNEVSEKLEEYQLIKYWAEDHKKQVNDFIVQLEQKLDDLLPKK